MDLSVNSILEGASEEEEVNKEDACYDKCQMVITRRNCGKDLEKRITHSHQTRDKKKAEIRFPINSSLLLVIP